MTLPWRWIPLLVLGVLGASCTEDKPILSDAGPDMSGGDTGDIGAMDGHLVDSAGDMRHTFACAGEYQWPVALEPVAITPSDTWKNSITPEDSFVTRDFDMLGSIWVKFTILLQDPDKVYFQNSNTYAFHHEFATVHLDPFMGMSRQEFEAVTLREAGQQAVVGAVIFPPPQRQLKEYAIQFERHDAMHPEMVQQLFEKVRASVETPADTGVVYIPTFFQQAVTQDHLHCFEQYGIEVGAPDRWSLGDECYSGGWALGRLKHVLGQDLQAAYTDGTLTPDDILLTDAVPSEVPRVAGIISLSPSTPNSHVAILSQTFGVPFGYLRQSQADVLALDGKEVILRVRMGGGCSVEVVDVEGQLPAETRSALEALAAPVEVAIQAKATKGALSLSTDTLNAADIQYVGGKAANFGLLRRSIPDNSPAAIALTFDLWDGFMSQVLPNGMPLGQEIAAALSGLKYPEEISQLQAALAQVRETIKTATQFTPEQQGAVTAALASFDPLQKIRFRSSTNVEDSEHFTGAGLYDSYSGCLADDADDDEVGPSQCDAQKGTERGVFRAIRKVFASFFNDNAYFERRRFGLDEAAVGMAILVHHSFPDSEELANGVATVIRQGSSQYNFDIVTQTGATSVTNPDSSALPEVAHCWSFDGVRCSGIFIQQESSLLPLGGRVLQMGEEYITLSELLLKVTHQFEQENPSLVSFTLDLEYKKIKPGVLVIKQVRRVPMPSTTPSLTPVLVGPPIELCTFQGEASDIMANHRVKSEWVLTPLQVELTPANRDLSVFASVSVNFIEAGAIATLSGAPPSWPGYAHQTDTTNETATLSDGFVSGSGADQRTLQIITAIPELVSERDTPILLLKDLFFNAQAQYVTPVYYWSWEGIDTRSEESVRLTTSCGAQEITARHELIKRQFNSGGAVTATSEYYWPPPPTGITAGYTAPLVKWVKTQITGLASQPITLTGFYSQTYRPGHHNFDEDFCFEPALEPGLEPAVLAEVTAKDVRAIIFGLNPYSGNANIHVLGLDGVIREGL